MAEDVGRAVVSAINVSIPDCVPAEDRSCNRGVIQARFRPPTPSIDGWLLVLSSL